MRPVAPGVMLEALLANEIKASLPAEVSVNGDQLTIEMGCDAMSCEVQLVVDALVDAGLVTEKE